MRWHVALRLVGSLLLVAAATIMSLQVRVGGSGPSGRSCGSSLDVITDRAGWEVWYAQDTVDSPTQSGVPLLRTLRCPGAVNARSIVAGALAAAGLVALVAASAWRRAGTGSPMPTSEALVVRLRRLGLAVTAVGAALMIAGLSALGLLLADRDATMFIFVRRSLVAAIGLVVLTPVLALLAGGRALTLLARALDSRDTRDETA